MRSGGESEREIRGRQSVCRKRIIPDRSGAHVAQLAERVLGKDEVTSSILVVGSTTFIHSDVDAARKGGHYPWRSKNSRGPKSM